MSIVSVQEADKVNGMCQLLLYLSSKPIMSSVNLISALPPGTLIYSATAMGHWEETGRMEEELPVCFQPVAVL